MKKIQIKTEKATLIIVDFPNDLGKAMAVALQCNPNFGDKEFKGFKLLGKVSEITEEEWKGIVDSITHYEPWTQHQTVELFYDYEYKGYSSTYTLKESGLSLLRANGILLENPLGIKPVHDEIIPKNLIKEGYGSNDFVDVLYDLHQWESAQGLVWSNSHIFIKTL